MIEIRPLNQLNPDELNRLMTGYTSGARYLVKKSESGWNTTIALELVQLSQPYIKRWDPVEAELFDFYQQLLPAGFSFGAYDRQECAGIVVCELRPWNQSLWVLELHVADEYRRHGIGRGLMEAVEQKARAARLRILVCETQNTNLPAIRFYRKIGFELEGLDLSYYTNDDFPDGEIALFMKKRLG